MTNFRIQEYAWNGSKWKDTGIYLTFDPNPASYSKKVEIKKRKSFGGLYTLFPKFKYRYKRTMTFTIRGACAGTKRCEIEFYSARNSKFKLDNATIFKLDSPEYYSERNVNPWVVEHRWATAQGVPYQTLYLIFEDVNFELAEGKDDWYTYTIKLSVVNNTGIEEA